MSLMARLADWIWWVPALHLLAALGIGLRMVCAAEEEGDGAERLPARLAEAAALFGLILLLVLDAWSLLHGVPGYRLVAEWFVAGSLRVNFSFIADGLALTVATLVALIGWLSLRFSVNYLHREDGFHRFFLAMSLFLGGMQLIVLAGNGLLAFCGWELVGLASFLLIGYARERRQAVDNALGAFVTNRIGDAGFFLGLSLAAWWFNSFEWEVLAGGGELPTLTARLLVFGFVVAALVKSAQLPFSAWIGGALEGPTPSSAIFYGSVMVHAGVYLLLRLEPLLIQAPDVMVGLVVAGGATALYAWLCGLVQTDIKSSLVFSALFQVALMFVACGLGWFGLALAHLCLHAAWRIWQFLLAPSWLHMSQGAPAPVPAWLQRQSWLYTAALNRFWLDRLGHALFVVPTVSLAADARHLDEGVIDRLLGISATGERAGVAGQCLQWLADRCQALESHLAMRERGGVSERLLARLGAYVRVLETLLEQPRYLMLAVMATFVVIL